MVHNEVLKRALPAVVEESGRSETFRKMSAERHESGMMGGGTPNKFSAGGGGGRFGINSFGGGGVGGRFGGGGWSRPPGSSGTHTPHAHEEPMTLTSFGVSQFVRLACFYCSLNTCTGTQFNASGLPRENIDG